jgi:hypothetical protein
LERRRWLEDELTEGQTWDSGCPFGLSATCSGVDARYSLALTSLLLTGSPNEGAGFDWEDRKISNLKWTVRYSLDTLALSEYTLLRTTGEITPKEWPPNFPSPDLHGKTCGADGSELF